MILKTNSWHYRLASTYALMREDDQPRDFCSYARKVLQGGMLASMMVVAAVGFLIVYVLFGAQLFAAYVSDTWLFTWNDEIVWAVMAETAILSSFALWILYNIWDEKTYLARREKKRAVMELKSGQQPGFFTLLLRTIREKTCFTVTFK